MRTEEAGELEPGGVVVVITRVDALLHLAEQPDTGRHEVLGAEDGGELAIRGEVVDRPHRRSELGPLRGRHAQFATRLTLDEREQDEREVPSVERGAGRGGIGAIRWGMPRAVRSCGITRPASFTGPLRIFRNRSPFRAWTRYTHASAS